MMQKTTIACGLMIAVAGTAMADGPVQWRVEDGGNGHWYEVMDYGTYDTWTNAAAGAVAQGGYLATATSPEENAFITGLYNQVGDNGSCDTCSSGTAALLGGQLDAEGDWRWVSGETWSYEDWYSGEPTGGGETCLYLRCPGQWNDGTDALDGPCRYAAIVEWDDTPPIQWSIEDGGNGHWYQLVETKEGFLWSEAVAEAASRGGYLVSLTSADEDAWVYANFDAYDRWIGALQDTNAADYSEPSGGWGWLSGEPLGYSNWNGGSPDNGGVADVPEEEYAHYCCGGAWNDIYGVDSFGVLTRKQMMVEYTTFPGAASGACCLDGLCITSTASDCAGVGGSWGGPNSSCNDFACPVACPGDIDGDGDVDGADLSHLLGAWGLCF